MAGAGVLLNRYNMWYLIGARLLIKKSIFEDDLFYFINSLSILFYI